jgi:acetyl esterase/lipase
MMRTLIRLTGILTALTAFTNLIEIRHRSQLMLAFPKLIAGVFTPWIVVSGAIITLFGWLRRDRVALLSGAASVGLAARHIARVSAPHNEFERAFGAGWEQCIPLERRARMLVQRWQIQLPEVPFARRDSDVVFAQSPETGQPLLCDIWLPAPGVQQTGLAVIYLHGSGWHYLDKDCGTAPFFRYLAGQGHIVMDVAYSLAPSVGLHGMVGDVKRAIAWLKAHAHEYGVDPARVVLMGGSAGGHLSLLAGYTPDCAELRPPDVGDADLSVCGVVGYYPAPDPEYFYRYSNEHFGKQWYGGGDMSMQWIQPFAEWGPRWLGNYFKVAEKPALAPDTVGFLTPAQMMSGFLGGTPDEIPDVYRMASPMTYIGPHCPPTLLLSGAHDVVMKPVTMTRLQQALEQVRVPCLNVSIAETDHGFDLFFPHIAPAFQAALYDVERFLGWLACSTPEPAA